MPEQDGKLTRDEMRTAISYFDALEKKMGKDLACEVCGNALWAVNSHIVGQRSDTAALLETHLRFPSVVLICTECGNQKFFVAKKVGIIPLGGQPTIEESETNTEKGAPDAS